MVSKIIEFQTISENDGSLTFFECNKEIPFEIKRCFYIYDVPKRKTRANHASTNTDFVLIAINGCVNVELNDGVNKTEYTLNSKTQGLLVPRNIWMKTSKFTDDAVLLVLASTKYRESKYINDCDEFENYINS